jgi:lipopolysaccharide transport system permease protein
MQTADLTAGERIRRVTDGSASADAAVSAAERYAADAADTRPVTIIGPPSLSPGTIVRALGRLVQYRDLLYTLTVHRLQVRYKQSALGWLWAVLQPLLLMLMYTVIFWKLARVDTGTTPYPLFAYSALLIWSCFSTAVGSATNSLVSHFSLVTKVYFPREILPITYVLASLVDLVAGSVVLALLVVYFDWPLTFQLVQVVPAVFVFVLFAMAVSLVLCAVQVRYRDIGIAMPLLLQLWMFATPVVYPLSAVPMRWRDLYLLNPMAGVVESFRDALLGEPVSYGPLAVAAAVSIVALPLAYLYFKHVESTVADVL